MKEVILISSNKRTTIGGQALIEGILMRGPKKTCIVVRKTDKSLEIKTEDIGTNTHKKFFTLPFIRGVVNFWDSLKYGISALTYSASFFEDDENVQPSRFEAWLEKKFGSKKVDDIVMGTALAFGILIPVGLFILLPTLITGLFKNISLSIVRNLIEGAIRILIFLGYIILTSKIKDIKRTYMYHGAEHKTIFCYEKQLPLTVENVRQQKRFHPRCGTSFLFVVMIISILLFSLFSWSNPFLRVVLRLALLPVVVAISYEINRFVGRHDNIITRILLAPGLFLQRFTTVEPDDDMIEVAITALNNVIPENENEDNW